MSELDAEKLLKEQVKATLARLKEVGALVSKQGISIPWGRGTRVNPLVRYEQEQRLLLVRLLRALPLAPLNATAAFEAEIERLMAEDA